MITPRQIPSASQVGTHYDELDWFYRDTWGEHQHHGYWEKGCETPEEAVIHLTRTAAALAGITRGARVCDIGCGTGGTSWFLAKEWNAHVVGYTLSDAQRRAAEATTAAPDITRPRFITSDWLDNDILPDSMDAAISIECVSHVHDKAAFFCEINRVLKPGGRASVCAWLSADSPSPWQKSSLLEPICHDGRLAGLATAEEYRTLIESAGFESIAVRRIGPQVRKTWRVIFRRLVKKVLTRRRYARLMLSSLTLSSDRIFALTILRLLLAYHTGALDYGLFTIRKP